MVDPAESKRKMRAWSTDKRVDTLKETRARGLKELVFQEDNLLDSLVLDDEMPDLPPSNRRASRQLTKSLQMSYLHESIQETKNKDFWWFQPSHRRASRQDIAALDRVVSGMTGRNAYLKTEAPPIAMLLLLPRMSAETETERDLILTSMRMYNDVLRVRELGSITSETMVKEITNPKGLSGGLNLTISKSRHQARNVLVKNMKRQVELRQQKTRINDKFQKSMIELRLGQVCKICQTCRSMCPDR
jgi:hypothetical protein